MRPSLFTRRAIWWPTPLGWAAILLFVFAPPVVWLAKGESFLARTERLPAKVLVVEGWIGYSGVRAAHEEFKRENYEYVVTVGGLTNNRWGSKQWNYASLAQEYLVRLGVAPERIIVAPSGDEAINRTLHSALVAREALQSRGLAMDMNVFTLGVHARRSRLIFARVMQPGSRVGVVSWEPEKNRTGHWWQSSERSQNFLKESVAFPLEMVRGLLPGRR